MITGCDYSEIYIKKVLSIHVATPKYVSKVVMRRTSESADFVISHPNPKIRKNHIRFISSANIAFRGLWCTKAEAQLKTYEMSVDYS